MTVKEARKEIENIEKTISILNDVEPSAMQEVFNNIEGFNQGADWMFAKLHIINSMIAYKNILKEKIDDAELDWHIRMAMKG